MKRADLYLRWKSPACEQRIIFELKLRTERENSDAAFEKLKEEALTQTAIYADKCKASESHIIIFDRREKIDWKEKVFTDTGESGGCQIKIWGM